MPKFLDTRGNTLISIGICARCSEKFPIGELFSDPNSPGLYVCRDDLDEFDPYRLAARATEDITFPNPRPDVPISGNGPTPIFPQPLDGVTKALPNQVWAANTNYVLGATTTPTDPNDPNGTLPIYQFLCTQAGQSGSIPPRWPVSAGVVVTDGGVTWLCRGIYLQ